MGKCEALIRKWFELVWVNGDTQYIEQGLAGNCSVTGLTPEPIETPEQFREFHHSPNSVFRDFNITLDHILENDNTFAGVVSTEVTHIPTNKLVKFKSSFFGTIKDDQIFEVTNLLEYLNILQQIGVVSPDFVEKGLMGNVCSN